MLYPIEHYTDHVAVKRTMCAGHRQDKAGVSANGEIINEIGVAVDHQAPMTAADLYAGREASAAGS
jgi:hypothetical protein